MVPLAHYLKNNLNGKNLNILALEIMYLTTGVIPTILLAQSRRYRNYGGGLVFRGDSMVV